MIDSVRTTKSDVVWNYVGTFASMACNFVLLPLLLLFLSGDQMGLWYVFTALSSFSQLLEFGFTATLSRNITYCLSGARELERKGAPEANSDQGVNWRLLKSVLKTSKIFYALIGVVGLVLAATVGTAYVMYVTDGFAVRGSLASWAVFVVSIFTNLYFLYCLTFLRGVGDVAGENRSKTIARVAQLAVTAVLLLAGLELLAASVGLLLYSVALMALARFEFMRNGDVQEGLSSVKEDVGAGDVRKVFRTISYVAGRDGIVSVAWYGATQATSLLCSAFLGLEETATYSVMLQFATAIYNLASAYLRSYFPMFQAAYVGRDESTQRGIVTNGISCYVFSYVMMTVLVAVFVLPLLTLFKSDFVCDVGLYLGMSLYVFLLNQHSLFCSLLVNMNEIPYFKSYLVSTCAGVLLSSLLCSVAGMGGWGLVLGQAVPQLVYNNWHWPHVVLQRLGITYREVLFRGTTSWAKRLLGNGA